MEFLSETEGDEYSVNPNYPYGKWYFYERQRANRLAEQLKALGIDPEIIL